MAQFSSFYLGVYWICHLVHFFICWLLPIYMYKYIPKAFNFLFESLANRTHTQMGMKLGNWSRDLFQSSFFVFTPSFHSLILLLINLSFQSLPIAWLVFGAFFYGILHLHLNSIEKGYGHMKWLQFVFPISSTLASVSLLLLSLAGFFSLSFTITMCVCTVQCDAMVLLRLVRPFSSHFLFYFQLLLLRLMRLLSFLFGFVFTKIKVIWKKQQQRIVSQLLWT